MKGYNVSLLTLLYSTGLLIIGSFNLHAVTSVYIPRTQADTVSMVCLPTTGHYGALATEYAQSMDASMISKALFGTCSLRFVGSQVVTRTDNDILADNFGLAPDFEGSLHFNPRIQNITVAGYYNLPLDLLVEGLYVNFFAPISHTRWSLQPCETIENRGVSVFPDGYMGDSITVPPAPAQPQAPAPTATSIRQALGGEFVFGDMVQPQRFQKITWCTQTKTDLAEFLIRLGRNFYLTHDHNISIYGLFGFPSGNAQSNEYVFSPVVGNGKNLQLGIGFQGAHCFELSSTHDITLTLRYDGSVEHLFNRKQLRTFDLKQQGPLSRYLLLKKIDKGSLTYAGDLISATFFTTFPVQARRAAQGQFSLKLDGNYGPRTLSIGYSLFGTTQETLHIGYDQPMCIVAGNAYGIKGTTGAYYFNEAGTTLSPLNATSSSSTITHAGAIDNANALGDSQTWEHTIPAYSSNPPRILSCNDIDEASGRSPAQVTQTFFLEARHTWVCEKISPSVAAGYFIETGTHGCSSLSQWGVWLQGALSF